MTITPEEAAKLAAAADSGFEREECACLREALASIKGGQADG